MFYLYMRKSYYICYLYRSPNGKKSTGLYVKCTTRQRLAVLSQLLGYFRIMWGSVQ